tara:strand:+ start:3794 stop:3922 length:129 start_codon:yes stop_codon:yes gene_type:complete
VGLIEKHFSQYKFQGLASRLYQKGRYEIQKPDALPKQAAELE